MQTPKALARISPKFNSSMFQNDHYKLLSAFNSTRYKWETNQQVNGVKSSKL